MPLVPRTSLVGALALLLAPLLPGPVSTAAQPPAPPAGLRSAAAEQLPAGTLRRAPAATTPVTAVRAPARAASLTSAPVSDITVVYLEDDVVWTDAAKRAFEAAVGIWERTVESAVPIVVEATATSFDDPTVLGGAGPYDFRPDGSGTFEPVALANARRRTDVLPGEPDVVAQFNPSQADLYFGADGNPPPDRIDFTTVVLHEIGHGLGLVGSAAVDGAGRATVGVREDGGERAFVSYDLLTYASPPGGAGIGGARVVDLPDGSAELREALTGGTLHWAGQQARTAAGGVVPLYSPSQWMPGSSYGHLDEDRYPREDTNSLMTPFLRPGEALSSPGQITLGLLADLGYAVPALRGSRYTPVSPTRVLDTRADGGAPVGPGGTVDLRVHGTAGVPSSATAVVLNVTGVAPTGATDVRVYPTPVVGASVPRTSALNLAAGRTRANLVTVPVGALGSVRLRNQSGSLHLVADLAGWYAPAGDSAFTAADPVRVLDTRGPDGRELGARTGTVGPGEFVDLSVVSSGPVPSDATAVALTVTAVAPDADTDVRVYPTPADDGTLPRVSNVNAARGTVVPNLVVVPLGPGGSVRLRNAAGRVHLLADVAGWYDDSPGGLLRPVGPTRVLDTRSTGAAVEGGGSALLQLAGVGGVPAAATSVVVNVTGVSATETTDVRVYPATAATPPRVSNLNLAPGETAADLVVVRLGDGAVRLRSASGRVDLLADVAGWFGPAA